MCERQRTSINQSELLFPFSVLPSPVGGPPRMTRSNSIPTHDASLELYAASPLGSTLSLAERPRSMGMVRSGSFRDKEPDEGESAESLWFCSVPSFTTSSSLCCCSEFFSLPVHGSVLSLASNASSSYSSVSVGNMHNQVDTILFMCVCVWVCVFVVCKVMLSSCFKLSHSAH